jgi:heme/copper-type cytochrome/quinol oxidase subunit 3
MFYMKLFSGFLFVLFSVAPLFAANDIDLGKAQGMMESIIAIFTSDLIRLVLTACLCGCAVAYGVNKDNEKMKRNIIAIAVAIGILFAASKVVEGFWSAP